VLIVSIATGGSSRGGKALNMRMLDINNHDCIRKERTEHTLEEVASEEVLSRAGCLAALN